MKQLLTESDIIPYVGAEPPGKKVMVVAPHPDDETLGPGGTLSLLVSKGVRVVVVFLTSGDKADPAHPLNGTQKSGSPVSDYALMREKEACRALRILGISEYYFLRYGDREVFSNFDSCKDSLYYIYNIMSHEGEGQPLCDAVYAPSPLELNPDHRAAAALALHLNRDYGLSVVFYEVTTPLRPNLIVDITGVMRKKNKAMRAYKSQLKLIEYDEYINSLNRVRALTLPGKTLYAEAFMVFHHATSVEAIIEWVSYGECLRQLM
ncbi:MAG: PIG-L family deacetylase [Nitrospirae bacterium]|nr:PIG-L family deacetylase [Nitrospirota bacterium]